MFPPLLSLVLLFGLLLRFPLGVFPLPLLALEKRQYLREQDTGPILHFCYMLPSPIKGNPYPLWDCIRKLQNYAAVRIYHRPGDHRSIRKDAPIFYFSVRSNNTQAKNPAPYLIKIEGRISLCLFHPQKLIGSV